MNPQHARRAPMAHLPLPDTRQPVVRWGQTLRHVVTAAVGFTCVLVLGAVVIWGVPVR